MATKIKPRPCAAGCGRHIVGRDRLCDDCASFCDCGRRKQAGRPRCRNCASRTAAADVRRTGAIVWVPNGRGIVVAKR